MPRRLVLLPLVLVAACSNGPAQPKQGVSVAPVNGLSTSTLLSCADLQGQLPKELAAGISKRPAVPASSTTAAYGSDPAMKLRCGVRQGKASDEPYTFDGVQWAMHDTGASRTWTTRGLKVNLEVEVPDHFDAQAELLGAMATAIRSALTR
ncbi:MAG: DUF3515 family protein [Mycobacteriales bacterium]